MNFRNFHFQRKMFGQSSVVHSIHSIVDVIVGIALFERCTRCRRTRNYVINEVFIRSTGKKKTLITFRNGNHLQYDVPQTQHAPVRSSTNHTTFLLPSSRPLVRYSSVQHVLRILFCAKTTFFFCIYISFHLKYFPLEIFFEDFVNRTRTSYDRIHVGHTLKWCSVLSKHMCRTDHAW